MHSIDGGINSIHRVFDPFVCFGGAHIRSDYAERHGCISVEADVAEFVSRSVGNNLIVVCVTCDDRT
jgi:hypothetical protein